MTDYQTLVKARSLELKISPVVVMINMERAKTKLCDSPNANLVKINRYDMKHSCPQAIHKMHFHVALQCFTNIRCLMSSLKYL